MHCQIEFVSSDSDVGMLCGKPTVTKCADCGAAALGCGLLPISRFSKTGLPGVGGILFGR
jgi:hypothetical protein